METKTPDAAPDPKPDRSSGPEHAPEQLIGWPPPGLSRVQGDLYVAAGWLGAGAFLILPLLWAVVARQDPWALSPLGDSLWLVFLFGALGIPMMLAGYVAFARLVRRSWHAVGQGHHWRVVWLTAADQRRDTGFLLQGAHAYRLLTDATRRRLATIRMVVATFFLLAALWLSLGFGISMVLAARGVLGRWGVVVLTLGPSVVIGLVAIVLYAWEEEILRKCRSRWYKRSWSQALVREEIQAWQAAMSEHAPGVAHPEELPDSGGRAVAALRASYVGLGAATIMAFLPVFTLVFSAAIIPILARISVPEFDRTVVEFASLEPLRAFALEPDTLIAADEAGAILHTLSFVGRPYTAAEGVLPPERTYREPWFPPTDSASHPSPEWYQRLVDRLGLPLPDDDRAYLDSVAAHPAHAELSRLARAGSLNITGVRWSMPLPSDITLAELSLPSMGTLRDAAYAHLAVAALQAADGQVAAADTTVRQVLSAGLLMADESPIVLDNLVGMVLTNLAGDALTSLYRNTGHPEADALAWGRASAERGVVRARPSPLRDIEATLRRMPASALDTGVVRGVRWEYVGLLNTLGPCINLQRVVFGPDNNYRNWLSQVERSLVRYPAEAELFQVARSGLLGRERGEESSFSTRLLALTMGDPGQPGSCARVLSEFVGF